MADGISDRTFRHMPRKTLSPNGGDGMASKRNLNFLQIQNGLPTLVIVFFIHEMHFDFGLMNAHCWTYNHWLLSLSRIRWTCNDTINCTNQMIHCSHTNGETTQTCTTRRNVRFDKLIRNVSHAHDDGLVRPQTYSFRLGNACNRFRIWNTSTNAWAST